MGFGVGAFSGGGTQSGEYTLGLNEKLILDDDGDSALYADSDDVVKLDLAGSEFARFDGSGSDPELAIFDAAGDEKLTLIAAGARGILDSPSGDMRFQRQGSTFLTLASGEIQANRDLTGTTDGANSNGTGSVGWSQLSLAEVTAPSTPTTAGVLYIADNAGTKELRAKFADGTEKVITDDT